MRPEATKFGNEVRQSDGRVPAVVGWGYRLSAGIRINGAEKPTNDFGYLWVASDSGRMETGDTIYLFKSGKTYSIDKRTQRVQTDEEDTGVGACISEDAEGPWLGALLAFQVGRLRKHTQRDRLGALNCQRVEWFNSVFVERRWHYRLDSRLVVVRYEVVYKDKQKGFVMMSGFVEPRVERVSRSLFEVPVER